MEEEKFRAKKFFHSSTWPKLEKLCLEQLVALQKDRMDNFCAHIIKTESKHGLFFNLLKKNESISVFLRNRIFMFLII